MLQWILAGFAGLSALTASAALIRLGTQHGIDQETLAKMRRETQTEEDARERARREADERREKDRRDADERRNDVLRSELEDLSRRSNLRFKQWRDTMEDLDELWNMVEDDMLPWMREAYRKLADAGIEMRRPPQMRRRRNADLADREEA